MNGPGAVERLELSRSKAKHPPAKVAQERQQITSKVSKNQSKKDRRQKMKLSNDAQDMRQRIENLAAKDLPERADRLARKEGIEYGAAVRQIIAEDEAFHHLPGGGSASGNDGGWRRSWPRGWTQTRRDTAMTNDIRDRALDLLEREDAQATRDAERRAEQEREGRLRDAIARVKAQDREIASEQARRGAEAEAEKLAVERHELEQRIEAEGAALNRSLSELESLDRHHRAALHRAGRPLGHDHRLTEVITGWWRARFGGWNSLTGTPSPHFNAEDRPLPERDPLARRDGS